jgi:hypothetical protein
MADSDRLLGRKVFAYREAVQIVHLKAERVFQ